MQTRQTILVPMDVADRIESRKRGRRNWSPRLQDVRSGIVIVICYRCEREWPGPADESCPHCGAEGGIEDHVIKVLNE